MSPKSPGPDRVVASRTARAKSTFCRTAVWLVSLFLLLVAAGCNTTDPAKSEQAQAREYLVSYGKLLHDSDADMKDLQQKTADVPASERDPALFADLMAPVAEKHSEYAQRLEALTPPSHLRAFHLKAVAVWDKAAEDLNAFSEALRDNDGAKIGELAAIVDADETSADKQLLEELRKAGYANEQDFERSFATPKHPLPAFLAFILMILVAGLAVTALQFISAIALLPIYTVAFASSTLDRRGFHRASKAGIALLVVALLFVASIVGATLAGVAGLFVWPRTQLSPWFVHLIFGWTALGFFSGRDTDHQEESKSAATIGCGAVLACLAGYIWAAVAYSTLCDPWRWCHNLFERIF